MDYLLRTITDIVNVFFLIYLIVYSIILFLSTITGSVILQQRKNMLKLYKEMPSGLGSNAIPISVLVPAYNEETTIEDSVDSLVSLDYELYEVIIVDDGSTDDTANILIDTYKMMRVDRPIRMQLPCRKYLEVYEAYVGKVKLTLIKKENGGKADSLNMGINAARFPYFVTLDADSMLQKDALTKIVQPICENDKVIAVGGLIRLSNSIVMHNGEIIENPLPKKAIALIQLLEYDRSFLASRIMMNQVNGNLIISGAFGLFQKQMVINVGGYDNKTVGEDMELVMKLHAYCRVNNIQYKIDYATDAICWTQVPESLYDLTKQRKRWHTGLLECLKKYNKIGRSVDYGFSVTYSYYYYLIFELLSPVIEILGLIFIVVAFAVEMININGMITLFLIYVFYGIFISLTSFFAQVYTDDRKVQKGRILKVIIMTVVDSIIVRQYFNLVRLFTLLTYRKNRPPVWEKLKRKRINKSL